MVTKIVELSILFFIFFTKNFQIFLSNITFLYKYMLFLCSPPLFLYHSFFGNLITVSSAGTSGLARRSNVRAVRLTLFSTRSVSVLLLRNDPRLLPFFLIGFGGSGFYLLLQGCCYFAVILCKNCGFFAAYVKTSAIMPV